jgi:hypothetical protein
MYAGVNNSKDVIKNRMLRHALNYWNIKNTEDLDPIVKLILEALSTELFNLGNDIKDTEVRLLEKIANLLAPEFLTCPNPAHALMHAMPIETKELLAETTHFYSTKQISSKQDETLDKKIDVLFTPVDKIMLFNAAISYLVSGSHLYSYDANFNKELLAHAATGTADANVLWLGLSPDDRLTDLNNLYFHFDWKNTGQELSNFYYQFLPLSKWYINDEEISSKEGLAYANNEDSHSARNLTIDYDLLAMVERDIKNYYDRKFITVSDERLNNAVALLREYPPEFSSMFAAADLQPFKKKLLWIKVVFPSSLKAGALDEVYVHNNTFPVMNRQMVELKYRLKGSSNIIPLKAPGIEQFLSLRSLADDTRPYRSNPFRKAGDEESGTFTIRTGGVERFDGRNAKEFISYLLELLRSESAAFSAYGNDFIASTLREMDQRIALMEKKTSSFANRTAEIPQYIIVKPYEGQTMMYTEFWTTLAEMANNIRSGTRMQEYSGVKTRSESLFLLTTTSGGKNRLKPEERVNAFRYGLVTRNRIITKEDIRNFCFYELGSRISRVEVEKGFEVPVHPKQSFLRTIDILITPVPAERLDEEGWQVLFDQLLSKLQSRSGMSNHYRIFLHR